MIPNSARFFEEASLIVPRLLHTGRRLQQTIDDLFRLTRIGRGTLKLEPVDVSAMVIEFFSRVEGAFSDHTVAWRCQPGIVVHADQALLRMVIENLLGNALKFTGGREPAEIEVSAWSEHGRRGFVVRDNGVGFDARSAERIFLPFQRAHSQGAFEGTGLGLAIVHRVLARLSGWVWAEGKVDQGASFYVVV
jgi:signal transduction histidine kinase